MSRSRAESLNPSRPLLLNIRRVALWTTLLALVVYLLASFVADLVVVNHFNAALDSRLTTRLNEVIRILPPNGPTGPIGSYSPQSSGDLDDAPIVLWWIQATTHKVLKLDTNAPGLPPRGRYVFRPTTMTVAGRSFRMEGIALRAGRIIAGTSSTETRSALSTLLLIEAILAPIALLALFIAAWVIGRRAAGPVERARQRQLEFTADASHELRTPLSVIEAEVGLALNMERSPASYRVALERVADESKRLRNIVEDLLWLARFDALPEAPPHEEVDVASVVHVCVRRFEVIAAQRDIAVSIEDDETLPPIIIGPAEWIDRLVSVLLDNACRYTNDGGQVVVSVSVSDDRVSLTVDDSGPGIAEEDRERIFERFHRANNSPGGAGLGLSIANAVVQATNGDWSVSRAPLSGARVSVSWPSA